MRVADRCDIDELYEIYSHESVSTNMGFDPCTRSEFDEIFSELSSAGELLVEEYDQGILAVCKVVRRSRRLRHSVYIGSLAVHHSQQGNGTGRSFFENIIGQLKKEGFTRIELLVAADNTRAITLFKSLGFVVEGTHRNYFSRAGSNQLFDEHTMAWVANR